MKKALITISILLLSTIPVWQWYCKRMTDGSDEPWGIIALATILILTIQNFREKSPNKHTPNMIFPSIILLVYAASYSYMAPLIRAVLTMTAFSATVSCLSCNRMSHIGFWALSMLSLPLIASLQFYAGFPLRVLVGELAVPLLRMTGQDVVRNGVGLVQGNISIVIDAPCSGIKMLWAGGYLVCILACLYRFNTLKTIIAGIAGIVIIIFSNVIRTTALFYTESEIIKMPKWAHSAIGMIVFVITALAIVVLMRMLDKWHREIT